MAERCVGYDTYPFRRPFLDPDKTAQRIEACLPPDWQDGWENVSLNVTAENQKRADERIPILLNVPAKHKGVMVAPFIGKVDLDSYLAAVKLNLF